MGCAASLPAGSVAVEAERDNSELVAPPCAVAASSGLASSQDSGSAPCPRYDAAKMAADAGQGPPQGNRQRRSLDISFMRVRKMQDRTAEGMHAIRSSFDISALPSSLAAKSRDEVKHAEYQHSGRRPRGSLDMIRSALAAPSMMPERLARTISEGSLLCPVTCGPCPLSVPLLELESQPQKKTQIRLLKYKAFLSCQKLLAYEFTKPATHINLPYAEVTDEMWEATAVVSWRWYRRSPSQVDSSFSPMSHVQLSELKRILSKEQGIKYVWIDFSCIPQKHSAHCMSEVMRSRLYFHKARRMIAIPAMVVLPNKNNIWPMLKGAIRAMEDVRVLAGHKPQAVLEVRATLKQMLSVALLSKRDYFSRAWALAERMARAPRGERLEHWMPLRLWISTVADLLWVASNNFEEDGDLESFPWDMLDAGHGSAMLATLREVRALCRAKGSDLWIDPETECSIAQLFLHAFQAWQSPLAIQSYDSAWLKKYMQEEALQRFSATLLEDTLWAVYGFYRHDHREFSDLVGGVQALCKDLGIDPGTTQWFNTNLRESKAAAEVSRRGAPMAWAQDLLASGLPVSLRAEMGARSDRGVQQTAEKQQQDFSRSKSELSSGLRGRRRDLEETLRELQSVAEGRRRSDTAEVGCSKLDLMELQAQMRYHRKEMRVHAAACRAITRLVRDKKALRLAESVGLLQDVYAVIAHHSDDRAALEQALLALYTLTRSAVSEHNVSCTTRCLITALQSVLQSSRQQRDAARAVELCCACLFNVTISPAGAYEALALLLVEDIRGAMRAHEGVPRVQEHCCGIVQNMTSIKTGNPDERERFLEALGHSHLMQEVRNAMEQHLSYLPVQTKALAAVLNMTCHRSSQEKAASLGMLEAIQSAMMEHPGSAAVQQLACDAITNINLLQENLLASSQLHILKNVQVAMQCHPGNQKVIDSACEAAWLLTGDSSIQKQGRELKMTQELEKAITLHSDSVLIQKEACAAIENILQL